MVEPLPEAPCALLEVLGQRAELSAIELSESLDGVPLRLRKPLPDGRRGGLILVGGGVDQELEVVRLEI